MSNRNPNRRHRDLSGSLTWTDPSNSYVPPLSIEDISHNLHMVYLDICKELFDCSFDQATYSSLPANLRSPAPDPSGSTTTMREITPYTGRTGTVINFLDRSNRSWPITPRPQASSIDRIINDLLPSIDREFNTLYEPSGHLTYPQPMQSPREEIVRTEFVEIDVELRDLDDLLRLIEDHPKIENVEYSIDMEALYRIHDPLKELSAMVGMARLKNCIVDQVIYYVQGFHRLGTGENDFMHTVIYGPPGTGKTEIARIIGKVFSRLGILSAGTFRKVTRADLIAGYLGQTAMKTRDVIQEALGGVLFIDEAYALGNDEKKDSFAKECIDTLCEALSDHKESIMVIVAGYEDELQKCFFNFNDGLESRFSWRFHTDDYTADELRRIFLKKVNDSGWSIDPDETVPEQWFADHMQLFRYSGRDMETLLAKTKICHSRRVFCKSQAEKTRLLMEDIQRGLELYKAVGGTKDEPEPASCMHMYV